MARILVVDDEINILHVLTCMLKSKKYDVVFTTDGQKAIDMAKAEQFDLLISDIRMNPVDGMTVLKNVRASKPAMPVLMLTAYGSVDTAKEAVELGAFGYMLKPFNLQELLITVNRALTLQTPPKGDEGVEIPSVAKNIADDIVARSTAMKDACDLAKKAAKDHTPVLICGGRGTGKSLIARTIHAMSSRKDNILSVVNCAVLPEPLLEIGMFGYVKGAFPAASAAKRGMIESTEYGTIIFDEIGWMPLNLQRKLYSAITGKGIRRVGGNENIPIDVRTIATAITPSSKLVKEGNVLQEMYLLLSANIIEIKDLKERQEDIMPLFNYFLRKESGGKARYTVASEVEPILTSYSWPENARELEHVAKSVVKKAMGDEITKEELPKEICQ